MRLNSINKSGFFFILVVFVVVVISIILLLVSNNTSLISKQLFSYIPFNSEYQINIVNNHPSLALSEIFDNSELKKFIRTDVPTIFNDYSSITIELTDKRLAFENSWDSSVVYSSFDIKKLNSSLLIFISLDLEELNKHNWNRQDVLSEIEFNLIRALYYTDKTKSSNLTATSGASDYQIAANAALEKAEQFMAINERNAIKKHFFSLKVNE